MSVKTQPRPVARILSAIVLDRIHVDAVSVSVVIFRVADAAVPVAWLPYTDSTLIALLIRHTPIPPAGDQVVVGAIVAAQRIHVFVIRSTCVRTCLRFARGLARGARLASLASIKEAVRSQ